ncbi:MAG: DUF2914 domain-containing protein [Nanobdellota archaeon]
MAQKFCILLVILFAPLSVLYAGDLSSKLLVNEMQFCTDIADRTPIGTGDNFSGSLEKIYCYTEVANKGKPVTISHVWYYNDQKVGKVYLDIGKSSGWRTWSSKKILKSWTGWWRVEVLSPAGEILETKDFVVGTGPEYEMTEY